MTEIVLTEDGSHTLYVPELDEHYHSVHGAVQESLHIFIKNGFDNCSEDPVLILEAGFGTGLNAYLTAMRCKDTGRKVYYTSIEKYPLPPEVTDRLNYHEIIPGAGMELFRTLHALPWNEEIRVSGNFYLRKIEADATQWQADRYFNLIYFDAFGPDKQPEMWQPEIFRKIAACTTLNGSFVTYSSKGDVKRKLRQYGFRVELLPGPPGKRHIIRAIKIQN